MNDKYKISIMLSSYNGETYISEQIESILNQENCIVQLIIRDDGSTDSTVEKIKNYQDNYPNNIKLVCGKNIGYRKSFMELLLLAPDSDFYGFADQDDYWEKSKCKAAIEAIIFKYGKNSRSLYASAVSICDENLRIIGRNDINSPNNLKSFFVRHRLGGCTMVFTKEIKEIAEALYKKGINNTFIDHDFMVGSVAYTFGHVIRDSESYILHRRSKNSVTSGGRGIINRIKAESFITFNRKDCHYDMARALLQFAHTTENKYGSIKYEGFLKKIYHYKKSAKKTIQLLFEKNLTCRILACDIETRIKILLHNF